MVPVGQPWTLGIWKCGGCQLGVVLVDIFAYMPIFVKMGESYKEMGQ